MDDFPKSVNGFKVMKLKFSENSRGVHHLLWKRHTVRTYSELKPPGRTLFVVNVPPYCTEDSLKNVFLKYGKVENIYFHKKPSSDSSEKPKYANFFIRNHVEGFKFAYVVFANESAVRGAMNASPSTELVLSTSEHQVLTGMQKWRQQYNKQFVSPEDLTEEIKTVMADYDKEKEEEKNTKEEEADEDGWVTVSSVKKKKPKLLKVNEFKQQTKRKKKKQQELVKFYAFQQRQTKIDKLAVLRKKFEEDKKRINMMKASRKFKPY